ncbi:DNA-binding protein [Desulforamulus aquiferis]|nr:helix-turn-helix transcriptional regulator [Desulforamulus aquiferis]RYD01552.1 DNA-binding protein [Desulforamulus aquiferis]
MNYEIHEVKFLQEIGNRLRVLREKKGLSQEALSFNCKLHRTYIGAIERGERNISILSLHKICIALDISISELFREDFVRSIKNE